MQENLDKILKLQKYGERKQCHTPKNHDISLSVEAAETLENSND